MVVLYTEMSSEPLFHITAMLLALAYADNNGGLGWAKRSKKLSVG